MFLDDYGLQCKVPNWEGVWGAVGQAGERKDHAGLRLIRSWRMMGSATSRTLWHIFPKQSLRCRVVAVLIRLGRVRENATVNSDQEKCILGDTCARLVYAKQQVASSNINIYNGKSSLLGPDDA